MKSTSIIVPDISLINKDDNTVEMLCNSILEINSETEGLEIISNLENLIKTLRKYRQDSKVVIPEPIIPLLCELANADDPQIACNALICIDMIICKSKHLLDIFVQSDPGPLIIPLMCSDVADVAVAAFSLVNDMILSDAGRSYLYSLEIINLIIDRCGKLMTSNANNEIVFKMLSCIANWCKKLTKEEYERDAAAIGDFIVFCFDCEQFNNLFKHLILIVRYMVEKEDFSILERTKFVERAFAEFLPNPCYNKSISSTSGIISFLFYDESKAPVAELESFPYEKLPSIFFRTEKNPSLITSLIIMISNISFIPQFVEKLFEHGEVINALIEMYQRVSAQTRVEIINLFWIFAKNDEVIIQLLHSEALAIMTDIFQVEDDGILELVRTNVFDTLRKLSVSDQLKDGIDEVFHEAIEEASEDGSEGMKEIAQQILQEIFPEED